MYLVPFWCTRHLSIKNLNKLKPIVSCLCNKIEPPYIINLTTNLIFHVCFKTMFLAIKWKVETSVHLLWLTVLSFVKIIVTEFKLSCCLTSRVSHRILSEWGDHRINQRGCWEMLSVSLLFFFCYFSVSISLFSTGSWSLICASEKRPTLRACLFYTQGCSRLVEFTFFRI